MMRLFYFVDAFSLKMSGRTHFVFTGEYCRISVTQSGYSDVDGTLRRANFQLFCTL